MDSSSFYKFNIIAACCEDICGHICIQKSNNDHFHEFTIFVSKITSSSFLLFRINKLDLDFLHRQILSLVCPSERTTWHRFYPTGPKGTAQRPTKKHAICLATLLQNKLNSDFCAFYHTTTHGKPFLPQIRLLTGLNVVVKRATSPFKLVLRLSSKRYFIHSIIHLFILSL